MSNTVLGILQIFPNKDDPDIKAVFNLKKGENFVGSSPYCEVIFPQNDIADVQCKISLDDGGEFFFSSVEEASGVYRTTPDGSLQKLKVNKEYELPINKAFYLGTKYKCLFIPKLGKSMPEPEARSPYKPYSTAYNGGNATKTQEMATLQIASLPYEMDELGYASQSQSDALSRAKPKLAGHLASLVHTADFRNSLDEYTQENGTMEDKSQNESEAGFGGLTVKTFRPKNSNRPSTDKDILPSLVPAYEDEDEFQRPEETPQKIVETKKTKSKQREEDEHVGLSLIARKGKNQLDEMSDEEEENEENEVEAEPASFRKGSKNNSPHDDMSILSSTRNTLARQDKEDSNDSTCIKSFKRKSEPGKVVGKMLGNMSSGNGRKSSEESEEEEPKEEAPDSGLVKHFKKKGNLMGTMLGLMKNKKGEQVKRMDTEDDDDDDDDEVLRPDLSQDIGGKTIAQQKKEQEKKREEEQRRKEQEEQKRRELEKKKEEEQRRKEIERKKEEEARIARKKEEEKRATAKRKEEEMKAAAKKKEEEMRAAAKKEEEEPVRGGRDSRKGQTKKEEDDSYKVKKELKEEEDEEKGTKGRKTSGSATAKGNTKKEKEEPIMEIETKKEDDRRKKGVKRENSEEKDYDSAESLDGLPFRKLSKLREEEIREKEKQDEERTRRGRKKSDADEDEEYSAKKKVVGKRGKKSAEKEKETESEKKKGKGGKKGKEEMEIEEDADDKKRKKRTTAGKKGKLEEGSLMDRLLKKQNEMVEMLRPYSDSDEDEEENPKYARGKKKTKESVKVKVKEEPKEVKKKGKVEEKVEEEEEEEKPRPKRGKKAVEEPKKVAKEPVERATRSTRSKGKAMEKPEKKIQEKNKKQSRDDEESEDEEEEEEEERVTRSTRRSKGKAAEKQEKKVQEKNKKQIRDDEESEDEEEDEEEEEEVNTRTRRSSRTAAKVETPKSNSKSKKDSPKKLTRTKSKEPLEDSDKGRKKVKTEAGSGAKDKKPVSQKSTAQKSKKKEVMEEETSDLDEINLPKRNSYRVIFSGFDPNDKKVDHAKKELDYLGVRVFEDKEKDFNVLVMEKFKRTIKFLLAVSRGVNIVSFKWVTDSLKEGEVLPPEDYVFTDKGAESKFKFRLSTTLQKAKSNKTPLMEDIRVWISPTIKPSHEELKLLVESLGGTVIKSRPTVRSGGVICLMNEEDTKTARQFSDMGLSVYSTELVYSAILQQKLNLHQNLVE